MSMITNFAKINYGTNTIYTKIIQYSFILHFDFYVTCLLVLPSSAKCFSKWNIISIWSLNVMKLQWLFGNEQIFFNSTFSELILWCNINRKHTYRGISLFSLFNIKYKILQKVCSLHHSVTMVGNVTIGIVDMSVSKVEILDVGPSQGLAISIGLILIVLVGLVIKGLFVYYIWYEAPKERPINTMILFDQVHNKYSLIFCICVYLHLIDTL